MRFFQLCVMKPRRRIPAAIIFYLVQRAKRVAAKLRAQLMRMYPFGHDIKYELPRASFR